jgi:hypothetical protein
MIVGVEALMNDEVTRLVLFGAIIRDSNLALELFTYAAYFPVRAEGHGNPQYAEPPPPGGSAEHPRNGG